jgi:hypothetical protein
LRIPALSASNEGNKKAPTNLMTTKAKHLQLIFGVVLFCEICILTSLMMTFRGEWVAMNPQSQTSGVLARPKLPSFWGNPQAPTRTESVPSHLSFAADPDGVYRWTSAIHPGDDVQFDIDFGWNLAWDAGVSKPLLDVTQKEANGQYIIQPEGTSDAVATRFRLKPGIQQSVEIHFTSRKL